MNYKIKRLDDPLYLPFAKNKLAQVDALRKEAGMFAMKKTYDFHGVRVIVEASDTGSSVSIITTSAGFLYIPGFDYDFNFYYGDVTIIDRTIASKPIINNRPSFEAWIENFFLNSNAQMRPLYAFEIRTNGLLGTEVNQKLASPNVYTINRSAVIYYDFKSSSRKFDILQEENQHLYLADAHDWVYSLDYGMHIVHGLLPISIWQWWYGTQHVDDNLIRAQNLLVRIATESLQDRVMTAADEEKRALKDMVFYLAISDGGSHEVRKFVSTVKLSFNRDMEKFVAGEIVRRDPVRMLDHLSGTRIQTSEAPFFQMYLDEEFYEEYRTLQGRTLTPSPYFIVCAPSGNRKSAEVVLIEEYKDEPDELKRHKVMQSGVNVTDTEYNKIEADRFADFLDEVNGLMKALLGR